MAYETDKITKVMLMRTKNVLSNATGNSFSDAGTLDTPHRWIAAMRELTAGGDPKQFIKTFRSPTIGGQMVVVEDIEFYSLCEHHLLPFFGTCTVGYIPDRYIIGLSKIPRIVNALARRPQVQERLVEEIADTLQTSALNPKGVGVFMRGQHLCMMARGIKQTDAIMTTTALRGCFTEANVKMEFLSYRRK